jgi:hypothetical protein
MGQLNNVEYGYDEHDSCSKCGMKEKDGCCNTELKIVKLEDSHQWEPGSIAKKSFALAITDWHRPVFLVSAYRSLYAPGYHSPPDQRTNFVYRHTGALLI